MSERDCPPVEELELALAGMGEDDLEAHLASCPRCRRRAADMRANDVLVAELKGALAAEDPRRGFEAPPGYTIESELHRGGQGVVYSGVEQETGRRVALKVPLGGRAMTRRQRRRFRREVESIAGLRHRHIVTLLASGAAESGESWFAMELVEGVDLATWLGAEPRSLEGRLGLFFDICSAVDYAHRNGVVHRDLKPSNILVDEAGEPRVLDFGLAKPIELERDASELGLTQSGEFLGSLAWSAPEQVRGDSADVDARTDVYALGVILYRMLTGRHPYPIRGSLSHVVETILEHAPVPPSRASGLASVDGTLDAIALRALEKEPTDRYPSAAALAEDCRRYLAGEPVEARHHSGWYALRRSVARRPFVSAAAALSLLASIGFASFWGARASELERRWIAAELEAGRTFARMGRVVEAEDRLWPQYLDSDSASEAARWALWQTYARNPCRASIASGASRRAGVLFQPPDGELLALVDEGGAKVDLYRVPDLELVRTLEVDSPITPFAVFSPEGDYFAALLARGPALWATGDAWNELLLEPPSDRIARLVFVPGGGLLVGAGAVGNVELWELPSGRHLETFGDGTGTPMSGVAVSPDGSRIVTTDYLGEVVLWNLSTRTQIWRGFSNNNNAVAFAPLDDLVALGDTRVELWRHGADGLRFERSLRAYVGGGQAFSFDPLGRWLASASEEPGSLDLWDLESFERARSLSGHRGEVEQLAWAPDGRWIASIGRGGDLKLWDTGDEWPIELGDAEVADATIRSVVWSPDGSVLATSGSGEGVGVQVWDVARRTRLQSFTGFDEPVSSVAMHPDRPELLAASSYDGTVRLWDRTRDAEAHVLASFPTLASYLGFDAEGQRLAVVFEDGSLCTIDVHSRRVVTETSHDGVRMSSLAWDPNRARFGAGRNDGRVLWFDAEEERATLSDEAHGGPVRAVAFGPDGGWFATGSDDRTVRLWRSGSRRAELVLEGHGADVYAVAIGPDEELLASGDRRGLVVLWDLAEATRLAELQAHADSVFTLAFAPGGGPGAPRLVSGGRDGRTSIWDLAHLDPHIAGNLEYQRSLSR